MRSSKASTAACGTVIVYDHLNEEIFDSLDDARRKLALWRYDYNPDRPHSSLANQTPQQARRTLEQFEGSAPGALAQDNGAEYPNPTCRLSL